jgi:hypothetical protein
LAARLGGTVAKMCALSIDARRTARCRRRSKVKEIFYSAWQNLL